MATKILAFSTSTRMDSYNDLLVTIAAKAARDEGIEVDHISLRDYVLPLYDGDLEEREGLPENVLNLKKLFLAHEGFLFGCAEYNGGITGTFKNVIDWVSRPAPNEKPLECFRGKYAGLVAASPGGFGGLRALIQARMVLSHMGVWVLPDQATVSLAHQAFDDHGQLKDPTFQKSVANVGQSLVKSLIRPIASELTAVS